MRNHPHELSGEAGATEREEAPFDYDITAYDGLIALAFAVVVIATLLGLPHIMRLFEVQTPI